jgi:hypothetical protein
MARIFLLNNQRNRTPHIFIAIIQQENAPIPAARQPKEPAPE